MGVCQAEGPALGSTVASATPFPKYHRRGGLSANLLCEPHQFPSHSSSGFCFFRSPNPRRAHPQRLRKPGWGKGQEPRPLQGAKWKDGQESAVALRLNQKEVLPGHTGSAGPLWLGEGRGSLVGSVQRGEAIPPNPARKESAFDGPGPGNVHCQFSARVPPALRGLPAPFIQRVPHSICPLQEPGHNLIYGMCLVFFS